MEVLEDLVLVSDVEAVVGSSEEEVVTEACKVSVTVSSTTVVSGSLVVCVPKSLSDCLTTPDDIANGQH